MKARVDKICKTRHSEPTFKELIHYNLSTSCQQKSLAREATRSYSPALLMEGKKGSLGQLQENCFGLGAFK